MDDNTSNKELLNRDDSKDNPGLIAENDPVVENVCQHQNVSVVDAVSGNSDSVENDAPSVMSGAAGPDEGQCPQETVVNNEVTQTRAVSGPAESKSKVSNDDGQGSTLITVGTDGESALLSGHCKPTDVDNGNLPDEEDEARPVGATDDAKPENPVPDLVPQDKQNDLHVAQSSNNSDGTDKMTESGANIPDEGLPTSDNSEFSQKTTKEKEKHLLTDANSDIPFADSGTENEEPNAASTESVGAAGTSDGAKISNAAGPGLALPVPGCSSEVPKSSSSSSVSDASKKRDDSPQSVYHIKWITFKEKKVPIVTQNENGPCPLLAILNFLFLKEKIKLPNVMEIITANQLMEYLGDCVFDQVPKNVSEDTQLNIEQNVHDAMSIFHKLQTGLDVNVKFTGVADFEYTSECIIFDILGIPMYHGWLVDPQSPEVQAAVGHCSYNQIVEKIILQKSSDKPELVTEALIAENFLERTASQLTYHGLCELGMSVKDEEMAVLFRNNHFSTIHKHKNELFLLVTDQGFLTESNVVWETLSNVEGDGNFVDADFRTYRKAEVPAHSIPPPPVPAGTDQQVDQDYLVALSLEQEQQLQQDQAIAMEQSSEQALPSPSQVQSDLQLALQLQEEENRRAAQAQNAASVQAQRNQQNQLNLQQQFELQQQEQQQQQQQEGRRKSGDCAIL